MEIKKELYSMIAEKEFGWLNENEKERLFELMCDVWNKAVDLSAHQVDKHVVVYNAECSQERIIELEQSNRKQKKQAILSLKC